MFQLKILSPEGVVYEGDVQELSFTSLEGETTILANHMAYLTALDTGEVLLKSAAEDKMYTIGKGIFSMRGNLATLLIEDVADSEELSEERAQAAMQKAQELIEKGATGVDLQKALYSLRRSSIDLKHIHKHKKKI